MIYQQTTQVPNVLFDTHLPNITTLSEIKILLVIIRQTNGWIDKELVAVKPEIVFHMGRL